MLPLISSYWKFIANQNTLAYYVEASVRVKKVLPQVPKAISTNTTKLSSINYYTKSQSYKTFFFVTNIGATTFDQKSISQTSFSQHIMVTSVVRNIRASIVIVNWGYGSWVKMW